MISVQLQGGLGNQLFQIMALIAHSIRTGIPFVFPEQKFNYEGAKRPTYWTTIFRNIPTNNDTKMIQSYPKYSQDDRFYAPIPDVSGDLLVQGYFQGYPYFEDVYDSILDIMGLLNIRREVLYKYVTETHNTIRVSMHFRRGDYIKNRCYHPVLTSYYYKNALVNIIKYLECETDKQIQIICIYETEDKDDVLSIVQQLREMTDTWEYPKLEYITELYLHLDDWEQLLVMSGCDHHIIANSTFSWWAAYLNPSLSKMVFYPDIWHGHQLYYIETNGLQVPGWYCISAQDPDIKMCDCW